MIIAEIETPTNTTQDNPVRIVVEYTLPPKAC